MHGKISRPAAKGSKDEEEQASTNPEERTLFFKQSWTESTRHKEFDIIMTAYSRAEALLKEHSRMVTDHLPTVEAAEASSADVTSVFRTLIYEIGGLEGTSKADIEKRSRVKVWMVNERLKPVTSLKPDDFWKVFWDIVRCGWLSIIPVILG